MLDRKGDAVYVGKARNLKARVQNYTNLGNLSTRLRRMVAETATLEVVVTHTEVEALLLECNLIKRLMPRYNVLLRDDKSFPLHPPHRRPRVPAARQIPRRARRARRVFRSLRLGRRGQPHADRAAARVPAALVQRQRVRRPARGRACSSRSSAAARPASAASTARTMASWSRRRATSCAAAAARCSSSLAGEMQQLSEALDFEAAALLRDRIRALTQVQGHQDITRRGPAATPT